jgi:hypothetical protein
VHTDLIRDFASPSRAGNSAACNHFKRAALCARGAMDAVERFFIALATLGFAGLFATFIWIVLVWFGVLALS